MERVGNRENVKSTKEDNSKLPPTTTAGLEKPACREIEGFRVFRLKKVTLPPTITAGLNSPAIE